MNGKATARRSFKAVTPEIRISRGGSIDVGSICKNLDWAKATVVGPFPILKWPKRLLLLVQPPQPKLRYYFSAAVTPACRLEVIRTFPNLLKKREYFRLFSYLVTGDFYDRDTGRLIVSRDVIAEILCRSGSSHVCAEKFLEEFHNEVLGGDESFGWVKTWLPSHKARQITHFVLPYGLQKAFEAEDFIPAAGKVCLCSGKAFSQAKQREVRKQRRSQAIAAEREAKSSTAALILNYLNNLPHHPFRKTLKNVDAAKAVVASIEDANSRRQLEAYLRATLAEPQPFYKPSSGEGDRLFGIGGCLTMLGGEVRKALAPHWHEADIKHSQFAICAWLWEVEEAQEFLGCGGDLWAELREFMRVPDHLGDKGKKALKQPLYSVCFGMCRRELRKSVEDSLRSIGLYGDGDRFLRHKLIRAMLKARRRMIKKIKTEGGMENCFGRFIPVNRGWSTKKDSYGPLKWGRKLWEGKEVAPHQILALVAQAIELYVLEPAFHLAMEHPKEFTICLFQHDGFSVRFHRREKLWKERIQEVVNERLKAMGIKTQLEWKD